jgi:hypothetical protein
MIPGIISMRDSFEVGVYSQRVFITYSHSKIEFKKKKII